MIDPNLLKELSRVENLPTLPDVVTRIMACVDSDDATAEDVAELMAQDAAITGQVLRMANSVFYNASGMSTSSVSEAVSRLGFREVRNVVVSLGVIDLFSDASVPFDYVGFWTHSLTTGIAAGRIASHSPQTRNGRNPRDNPYFIAGLLHDVGILLLCEYVSGPYAEVHEQAVESGRSLMETELDMLGVTHAEVGAALIRRWGLPWDVAVAAQHHHRPSEAPPESRDYVHIVHMADWISNSQGHGYASELGIASAVEEATWSDLGVSQDEIPVLNEEVAKAAEESQLLLSVAMNQQK